MFAFGAISLMLIAVGLMAYALFHLGEAILAREGWSGRCSRPSAS